MLVRRQVQHAVRDRAAESHRAEEVRGIGVAARDEQEHERERHRAPRRAHRDGDAPGDAVAEDRARELEHVRHGVQTREEDPGRAVFTPQEHAAADEEDAERSGREADASRRRENPRDRRFLAGRALDGDLPRAEVGQAVEDREDREVEREAPEVLL